MKIAEQLELYGPSSDVIIIPEQGWMCRGEHYLMPIGVGLWRCETCNQVITTPHI